MTVNARIVRARELLELDRLAAGEDPHPEIVDAAVRELARRHPYGGNQLCAALRAAFTAGWTARHALAVIREEQ